MHENLLAGLIAIIAIGLLYAISWILVCGIIKLITLCFGLTFYWSVATGIWLILCLLKLCFPGKKK